MSDKLKTVIVSDAFMHEEYYRRCFEQFPEYDAFTEFDDLLAAIKGAL